MNEKQRSRKHISLATTRVFFINIYVYIYNFNSKSKSTETFRKNTKKTKPSTLLPHPYCNTEQKQNNYFFDEEQTYLLCTTDTKLTIRSRSRTATPPTMTKGCIWLIRGCSVDVVGEGVDVNELLSRQKYRTIIYHVV